MRRTLLLLSAVTALGLGACKKDPAAEGGACKAKEDCLEGLSCVDGVCLRMPGEEQAAEPTGYCGTLAALAGSWTFDTTVIGAEDLAPRGINGHFQMTVSVDNCEAKVELSKSGYDDVVFSKSKVQHSEAALSESQRIPTAAEATFSLKDKPTHTMTFMVRDGQLFGYYNYAEAEWQRAGFWGFLRGVKIGQDLAEVEDFSAQPCEVRCLTQCDVERRRTDGTLDEPALAACMTACGGEEPIVGCGAGEPLPNELLVAVNGPVKTFEELCAQATSKLAAAHGVDGAGSEPRCIEEPEVKGKPTKRSIEGKRLEGSFTRARMLEVGVFDAGYYGELILALETEQGFWWTDAIADVSQPGFGGVLLSIEQLKLSARDMLSPTGREIRGEVRVRVSDSDLGENEISIDETKRAVVCATGSPPTCVALSVDWSSERTLIDPKGDDPKKHPSLGRERGEVYVAILPEDRVSISAPADAREVDRELAGIYAWPK